MKVAGDYTFDAPQDVVWDALQDPEVLAAVMPGCEKLELVGEDEYEGILKIKVGPVQGKFSGNIKLEDIEPPNGYKMIVDGKGAPGFVKATGGLQLESQGDKTLLTYEGDARIGGRIASVGQRLIDSSAKSIIRQSLEAMNGIMVTRAAANNTHNVVESGTEAVEGGAAQVDDAVANTAATVKATAAPPPPLPKAEAPSQVEFATNVAKDVAKDLIPEHLRTPLIIGGVVVLLIIIYLILS